MLRPHGNVIQMMRVGIFKTALVQSLALVQTTCKMTDALTVAMTGYNPRDGRNPVVGTETIGQ
jgi:hypothetical protein